MELTPRLQRLADWVPDGVSLSDVGTDHGYLPAWLRLNGRIRHAIASDLRPGPLERARQTGREWGVDEIEYRLCSGLSDISPQEAEVITIAGMGAETIISILRDAPWTQDGQHLLLLQPQSHPERLRAYLSADGYAITRECLVCDRGTIYPILEVRAGEQSLTLGQLWGGVGLACDPLGDRYYIEKIVRLQTAAAGRIRAHADTTDELRDVITALYGLREEWRHANSTKN